MFTKIWSNCVLALVLGLVGLTDLRAADKLSDDGVWRLIDKVPAEKSAARPNVRPSKGQHLEINAPKLWDLLDKAPREFTKAAEKPAVISLPMPDGSFAAFEILDSPIMEQELADQFPEIRTCVGWGIDDPDASLRLDWTMHGFHAQVLSPKGSFYIDPFSMNDPEYYTSYYKRDFRSKNADFQCLVQDAEPGTDAKEPAAKAAARSNGTQLRTYRLANAATAEYTAFHGGTVSAGQAAIVTAINRVVGIYEQDLSIRMILVGNNSNLVFTNTASDGYTNDDPDLLLDQNQAKLDSLIGSSNYDIGHVFSTGGGGLAGLGVVCEAGFKAQGETGSGSPTGDPFYVDYVAHEMGHQFGANHTFNGSGGSCGGNRSSSSAYEPGSGTTIMAYAGICDADDLQSNSDPYFHFRSLDEILAYTIDSTGNNCAVKTSTGNTPPTVNAGSNYAIPKGTPFTLTAVGSDANGDSLTYCWEQADLGGSAALSAADNGSIPLFRTFNPTSSPSRTFPRLSNIINNVSTSDEKLPSVNRPSMDFRCTVRDNRAGGGGVADDSMALNVVGTAGPFLVTYPNAAETVGGTITVTWDVANTTAAPISTSAVKITLSTDGGLTFPTILTASTPNDGTQAVTLPAVLTTTARIKVEAVGNVYFDMSNANFTISSTPDFELTGSNAIVDTISNGNNNGAIEPGEQNIQILPQIRNISDSAKNSISGTLTTSTPGVTISVDSAAYPDLASNATGNPLTAFQISVSDSVACGSTLDFVLTLSGGGSAILAFSLPVGSGITANTDTYAATGLPLAITDFDVSTHPVNSTVNVASSVGTITKVRVLNVNVPHTFSSDLDLELISPQGTVIMLATDLAFGVTNAYTNTVFDDAAATPITSASPPFTGSFQPDEPLASFIGQSAIGTWSLRATDFVEEDTGSINSWTLEITTSSANCSGPATSVRHPELYK